MNPWHTSIGGSISRRMKNTACSLYITELTQGSRLAALISNY
jgi:hypothetical protein